VRLLVGLATKDGRPVGLAPLMIVRWRASRAGPWVRSVRFLGDGVLCPDHLVLPVGAGSEEAYAAALHRELQARRAEWDRVELRDLLESHRGWRAFERVASSDGAPVEVVQRTHCPYAALPVSWDEYLSGLSRHRRASVRREMKQFEGAFTAGLTEPGSVRDVDRAMETLADLHSRTWRERGQTGIFHDPRVRLFHGILARRAFRSNTLWMLCLQANERTVAVSYGFKTKHRVHGYQHGFDPEYRGYGVGMLVRIYGIRRAIERGISEWDFLRGTTAYKYTLAPTGERRGHDVIVHSRRWPDRAATLASGGRALTGRLLRRALTNSRIDALKRLLRIRD
jgi:CelD/BcsL family acetyltransferase involved in cellulose biosynthesis